jgi:hypothetical protein
MMMASIFIIEELFREILQVEFGQNWLQNDANFVQIWVKKVMNFFQDGG